MKKILFTGKLILVIPAFILFIWYCLIGFRTSLQTRDELNFLRSYGIPASATVTDRLAQNNSILVKYKFRTKNQQEIKKEEKVYGDYSENYNTGKTVPILYNNLEPTKAVIKNNLEGQFFDNSKSVIIFATLLFLFSLSALIIFYQVTRYLNKQPS